MYPMHNPVASESFFWHKLHSLAGIFPVGYYLVQHLVLNSFSLGGPKYFDGVVAFFEDMPKHFLFALKAFGIWIPLIFHATYGLFITSRGLPNITKGSLQYRENWYYTLQRVSGIVAFIFLAYHMTTTSVYAQIYGTDIIKFDHWITKLSSDHYLRLYVYMVGVLASSYHFSYGIWSFCIRWGITISEKAQRAMWKFSTYSFIAITAIGWTALAGFLIPWHEGAGAESTVEVRNGFDTAPHPDPFDTSLWNQDGFC